MLNRPGWSELTLVISTAQNLPRCQAVVGILGSAELCPAQPMQLHHYQHRHQGTHRAAGLWDWAATWVPLPKFCVG